LRKGTSRAYIPDGILVNAFEFHQHSALVVDSAGLISSICAVENLPSEMEQVDCASQIFVAAPILAHAHLESFDAPNESFARDSFAGWVKSLLEWRSSDKRMSPAESASHSCKQLALNGCGLVATHVSEPGAEGDSEDKFPEVIPLVELFLPQSDASALSDSRYQCVALHAPYSVADDMAQAVFSNVEEGGMVSIHLGEHAEERQFLRKGEGALASLFVERGLVLKDRSYSSAVDWLKKVGGLNPSTLAVHCTDLSAAELSELASADVGIVFCPGTHLYFNRSKPEFAAVTGLLPALGCDSLASNLQLDPLYELRSAKEIIPEISGQQWWQSLTQRGAEVLRRPDLGSLSPGKQARVLSLSSADFSSKLSAEEICEVLCTSNSLSRELLQLNSSGE
jgi:cytosine/adenosine deaminase-related metal-dependent hydrolase